MFLRDLRVAAREIVRNPGFSAAAVACLALGIGATITVFSVVNNVVLEPLPYNESEELVMLWNRFQANGEEREPTSGAEFVDFRDRNTSLESVATVIPRIFNLTGDGTPERLVAARTSASLFPLLGVTPVEGRLFRPEEDRQGNERVVLLTYELWNRRFGGDPGIVGTTLDLSGEPYEVVGVLPEGFEFDQPFYEMWVPIALNYDILEAYRQRRGLRVYGRLAEGTSLEQAQADFDGLARQLREQYPDAYPESSGFGIEVASLHEETVGDLRPALLVLLGAVVLVLLIACVNVANLLMARALTRQREVAVRSALGAERWDLVRRYLADGLLLAILGGGTGLLLAYWALRLVVNLDPGTIPRLDEVGLDLTTVLVSLALILVTGLLFATLPALQRTGALPLALKEGGRGGAEVGASGRARSGLVVAEVALAFVVLVGSGLALRSFSQLLAVDPGFDAENVLTMQLWLPQARYGDPVQIGGFVDQLLPRVEALPQVERAAVATAVPLGGISFSVDLTIEGQRLTEEQSAPRAELTAASPGFLGLLGIRQLQGRDFGSLDHADAAGVALINEAMAERYWPDQNPIGRRVELTGRGANATWHRVVGIVPGVRSQSLDAAATEQIYVPFSQQPAEFLYLVVKSSGPPAQVATAIKGVVQSVDPNQAVSAVRPLTEMVDGVLARPRFNAVLFGTFAGVALLLAMLGVYGVMAYSVARRTREIGIRLALGSDRRDVLRQVLLKGLTLVGIGVLTGIVLALLLGRTMESLLFGITTWDAATFLAVTGVLVLTALLASYLPALRATRVQPVEALRFE